MESTPSPQDHRQDQDILDLLENLESARVEYPSELLAARRAAFLAEVQKHSNGKEGVQKERPARQQFTKRLKELQSIRAEYPADLLAARRAAFIAQVEQQSTSEEELTPQDEQLIQLFENLKTVKAEYPPDLLVARRAAFIAQVEQQSTSEEELTSQDEQLIHLFENVKTAKVEYPLELLAARRAAFIAQVEQQNPAAVEEQLTAPDEQLIRLFKSIKTVEPEYPPLLLAARRSAFARQAARGGTMSVLDVWRSWIQRLFLQERKLPSFPSLSVMRTSAVIAILMVVAYIGSLLNVREPVMQAPAPGEPQVLLPGPAMGTDTEAAARIICKPGYLPPLCLAKESEPSDENLTYQGNGVARPAVAKDTLPGYSAIHKAAYINDGLYGPGASWISNSPYSWIKIDLGKTTSINTVTFGRDRLGNFNDRDPGQFVIAVALSDDVYADGNSSNDYIEYTQIYTSEKDGFSGVVAGPETVRANFGPIMARYVKITFANPGAAVDEVEVFMVQPPVLVQNATRRPKDDVPSISPTTAPTRTSLPSFTHSPVPTDTPAPTDTLTPRPTSTPEPTDTSTPRPTRTPTPVPTNTQPPTRTPSPVPTNTQPPTRTPTPVPTDTEPPTRTPLPEPTDTPQPTATPVPTATSVPTATDVPPPTDTPVVVPTETPMLMDEVWPDDFPTSGP